MLLDFEAKTWTLIAGFSLGLIAGLAARGASFCTFGAIADVVVTGNHRRLRSWALALAIAVIGSQGLQILGILDLGQSMYLAGPFNAVMVISGGLMFGIGMALVGTCGFGTLLRLGGGDLRALIDMACLGFFAYLALSGPIAYLRLSVGDATALSWPGLAGAGLVELAAYLTGFQAEALRPMLTAVIVVALLSYVLQDKRLYFRQTEIVAALAIGAIITLGWAATGILGHDPFDPAPPVSLTFVRPIGESFLYVMLMSGLEPSFGIATVAGVLIGAHIAARARGELRLEGFDGEREMTRHLSGAALMGVGGILALGCTIGQGMSAMSTLALSAPLSIASIIVGAAFGLRYLEEGSVQGALRVLTGRDLSR